MARCLIIGCGCRGQQLSRELQSVGHAVRGTTRSPDRMAAIEASGAEAVLADPDRVATLVGAFDHVTVVCILLASAAGSPEQLAALHGPRLEMLLTKLIDTTARGVVYEARGEVDARVLAAGTDLVRGFARRSSARCVVLQADPASTEAWVAAALGAVGEVMDGLETDVPPRP